MLNKQSTMSINIPQPQAQDMLRNPLNPLVMAANPLLNAIPKIRNSATNSDPTSLRQQLINEIKRFEIRGQRAGLSHEVLIGARYCLCTALDEAATLTPWGRNNVWSKNGLLVTFHNETWGGEKFFQLLAKLSQSPKENILLLELMNYCLLLGFEGRYHVIENGRSQLETLKHRLLQLIHSVRGEYPAPLSGHAFDLPVQQKSWYPMLPLWACTALMGFIASLWFIGLDWRLGDATSPVLAAIYQTKLPRIESNERPNIPIPPLMSLRHYLEPEIRQGLVIVRDEDQKSIVILRGDGLFHSASTTVRPVYQPVITRVAHALNRINGKVVVFGYTDSDPIRTARFASNWELSQKRAESVKARLQEILYDPNRVRAEGRADLDPVAPNTSKENKALNRRVEITLLLAPSSEQIALYNTTNGEK